MTYFITGGDSKFTDNLIGKSSSSLEYISDTVVLMIFSDTVVVATGGTTLTVVDLVNRQGDLDCLLHGFEKDGKCGDVLFVEYVLTDA